MPATPARTAKQRKIIDLDAARKARAEQDGPPPAVRLGGEEFDLPAGLPAFVLVGLARARNGDLDGIEDVFAGLFGQDNLEKVMALGLELDDLETIMEQAYDETPGEAQASEG